MYGYLVALGLHYCMQAFSSCGGQRLHSNCGVFASHYHGFSCCRAQALGLAGFSSWSTRVQWLQHMGVVAS